MPWLARVRAVLVAWYPGQENGNAIASVLYGEEDPAGKLPVTFPETETDLPTPVSSQTVPYDERLAIGYRALDAAGKDALFPFGYGLSYTTYFGLGVARRKRAWVGRCALRSDQHWQARGR